MVFKQLNYYKTCNYATTWHIKTYIPCFKRLVKYYINTKKSRKDGDVTTWKEGAPTLQQSSHCTSIHIYDFFNLTNQ
jgi:hypothetical protein